MVPAWPATRQGNDNGFSYLRKHKKRKPLTTHVGWLMLLDFVYDIPAEYAYLELTL